jgi:hypothetical protein
MTVRYNYRAISEQQAQRIKELERDNKGWEDECRLFKSQRDELDKENDKLGALANRYHLELTRYRNALERITLTEPIGEVAYRIAREALNPISSSLSGE